MLDLSKFNELLKIIKLVNKLTANRKVGHIMTQYQENIRQNLINKQIHVNDDTLDFKIGHVDPAYDYEEHEQFV